MRNLLYVDAASNPFYEGLGKQFASSVSRVVEQHAPAFA